MEESQYLIPMLCKDFGNTHLDGSACLVKRFGNGPSTLYGIPSSVSTCWNATAYFVSSMEYTIRLIYTGSAE